MTTAHPDTASSSSARIHGGAGAPGQARSYVLARLDGRIAAAAASDAALIVSELVTNSVLHANVGPDQPLSLELTTLDDRLRVSVTDPGSQSKPRLLAIDPSMPHGFGLRLVDDMSCAWGVRHDADGTTCVWCELALDPVLHT